MRAVAAVLPGVAGAAGEWMNEALLSTSGGLGGLNESNACYDVLKVDSSPVEKLEEGVLVEAHSDSIRAFFKKWGDSTDAGVDHTLEP